MSGQKERFVYFDYLRILCAVGVVCGHVCTLNWISLPVDSSYWMIINAFNSMCHCVIPVFFMISGALFLDKNKQISIKKLYKNNILRLLVAYVVWTLIYAAINKVDSITALATKLSTGHYHMWFIPAIIGCYMTVPILRKITESKTITKYFLILGVLINSGYNHLVKVVMVESQNGKIAFLGETIKTFIGGTRLYLVLGYSFSFVLGYYLHTKEFNKKERIIVYVLGVVGGLITLIGSTWVSISTQTHSQMFFDRLSINVLLMAVAVFVFAKYNFSKIKFGAKGQKFVQGLSKATFGSYLIHAAILDFINTKLNIDGTFINPIIGVPLLTIGVFAVSIGVSWVLNKIPIVNKYLV